MLSAGPEQLGPARPQTPRQRFSPLHPDPVNSPAADKRHPLPVRDGDGDGKWKNALRVVWKSAGSRGTGNGKRLEGRRKKKASPVFYTHSSTTGLMTGLFLFVKIQPSTGKHTKGSQVEVVRQKTGFMHASASAGDQSHTAAQSDSVRAKQVMPRIPGP